MTRPTKASQQYNRLRPSQGGKLWPGVVDARPVGTRGHRHDAMTLLDRVAQTSITPEEYKRAQAQVQTQAHPKIAKAKTTIQEVLNKACDEMSAVKAFEKKMSEVSQNLLSRGRGAGEPTVDVPLDTVLRAADNDIRVLRGLLVGRWLRFTPTDTDDRRAHVKSVLVSYPRGGGDWAKRLEIEGYWPQDATVKVLAHRPWPLSWPDGLPSSFAAVCLPSSVAATLIRVATGTSYG